MLAVTVENANRRATKQIHADEITHRLQVVDEADTKNAFSASSGDSFTYWFHRVLMTDLTKMVPSWLSQFVSRSRVIFFFFPKRFLPIYARKCKATKDERATDIASDTMPLMHCNWMFMGCKAM